MLNGSMSGFVAITKVDDDKRMVYGIANSDTLDCQDEIVEWEATKQAIPEFCKWRNLREMHGDTAAGTVPELEIDDVSKKLNIGAKVVDDSAWKKVKEGVYKGFSIGGKALERIKEFNTELGKNISRVKKYVLNEISLVDRPANPDCVFTMMKRADNDIPSNRDPLSKDLSIMRKIVSDLDGKVLTDNQIDKLGDNAFAFVKKNGDNKERLYPIPDKAHAMALMKQLMSLKVTDGERHIIHENIKKSLGSKHSVYNCTYCQAFMSSLIHKGGDQVMDKQKLLQAQALIEELLAEAGGDEEMPQETAPVPGADQGVGEEEEFEDQEGEDVGPETENIVDAPQKDETEAVDNLQGSDYSDKEGGEDQEGFDDSTLDYSEGETEDENRTHLYDTESERGEKAEMEGGDCPYCGSTVKALLSGRFRKGTATCPGCHTEYGVNAKPKVVISKRGGRQVIMRKSAAGSLDPRVIDVLGNLAKAVKSLDTRMTKAEARPLPRKTLQKRGDGATEVDGDVTKVAEKPAALKADEDKALAIVKATQGAGRQMTPEERAFTSSVSDRLIDFKIGKVS